MCYQFSLSEEHDTRILRIDKTVLIYKIFQVNNISRKHRQSTCYRRSFEALKNMIDQLVFHMEK